MAKARVEKPKYNPITLVLDTEEEAKALWHALNVPRYASLAEYAKENGLDINKIKDHVITIFACLDDCWVYKHSHS